MSKRDLVALFDLDGVIIDSEDRYTQFWSEIERVYPTGIANYPVAIKGTTLETILVNYPDPRVREDVVNRLHVFQDSMEIVPYPGALDFIMALREAGIKVGLVTSSDARKMVRLFSALPELRMLLDEVIDGSMVTRSKPDPEGYIRCANLLGYPSEKAVVFEDSIQGLKAGRRAGGKVVGVATTYPATEIAPLADIVVESIAQCSIDRLRALFSEK